jgi:hypothetical protein
VTARRYLFVAVTSSAMGELTLARGIAADLHARGDTVAFLAPAASASVFSGTPFRHVPVDDMLPRMSEKLPRLLRAQPPDLVVLVDLTSVFLTLEMAWAQDTAFLADLPVPTAALDVWDIAETDLQWDFGTDALAIPPRALEIRRVVPVPFVRPRRDGRCYNALPSPPPVAADARERIRRELGLGSEDRLVLLLSSRWQLPAAQFWKHHRRLAEHVPALALEALAALGPRVHVAHVGPEKFAGTDVLGERYHWLSQLAPDRFAEVGASADLLLSFATSSPAAFNALVQGVPVVLAINSRRGKTVEEVEAALPRTAEAVHRWLGPVVPLHPFRLWPIGLHGLLTPAMRDNPFNDAVRTVELLDWEDLVGTCREVLFEASERERLRASQAAYCERVRTLPRGADLLAPPASADLG